MKNKVPDILLIYTGGTIGMVKDYKTNALKAFNFGQIKDKIPELNLLDCNIETVSFSAPIDSSDMSPAYWVKIAEIIEQRYHDIDGFVVLSGTDTMSYNASAMSFMLENLNKPVIFTGSQLPIGDLRTDAKENLITAIQVAATQENGRGKIREVGLYFEYKLYRANRTTKVSAEQFEAFESPNFPHLGVSGVHLIFNDQWINKTEPVKDLIVRKRFDANVIILKLFPGINQNMMEYILNFPELDGVILETYGAGNAPTAPWFIQMLRNTLNRKIPVINVTQCTGGSVLMGHYESSIHLKEIGIINGKDITTESALAKLKYLLGLDTPYKDFKVKFEQPLRGEMS
jgi:L-asparaginase